MTHTRMHTHTHTHTHTLTHTYIYIFFLYALIFGKDKGLFFIIFIVNRIFQTLIDTSYFINVLFKSAF